MTIREEIGTLTYTYTELSYFLKHKEYYTNIIQNLINEGWTVYSTNNDISEYSNDVSIYNPEYKTTITLYREFNLNKNIKHK